jgi:hypothetical protein
VFLACFRDYAPGAHLAEFLIRAGQDVAHVLARESVTRDPTLAGESELCGVFDARLAELATRASWVEGRG